MPPLNFSDSFLERRENHSPTPLYYPLERVGPRTDLEEDAVNIVCQGPTHIYKGGGYDRRLGIRTGVRTERNGRLELAKWTGGLGWNNSRGKRDPASGGTGTERASKGDSEGTGCTGQPRETVTRRRANRRESSSFWYGADLRRMQ